MLIKRNTNAEVSVHEIEATFSTKDQQDNKAASL